MASCVSAICSRILFFFRSVVAVASSCSCWISVLFRSTSVSWYACAFASSAIRLIRRSYSWFAFISAPCSSSFVIFSFSMLAKKPGYCFCNCSIRSFLSCSLSFVSIMAPTSALRALFSSCMLSVFSADSSFARSWALLKASCVTDALFSHFTKAINPVTTAVIAISINPHGEDRRLFFSNSFAFLVDIVAAISAIRAFVCAMIAVISFALHSVIALPVAK